MKKAILVGLTPILAILFLISCGVPQEDYDRINKDLTTAQIQIQALQDEKESLQAQIRSLQAEQLTQKEKIDDSKARIEVLNALLMPALTGELYTMTEMEALNFFLNWRDKIKAVGDPILAAKFEVIISGGGSNEATTDFFLYLLKSIPEALK